jgi:hypothetical protein
LHTKKHATPFLIELKPSKIMQRLLIAIHLIALGASFTNALPLILKLGTAVLIGLNFKLTIPRLNNGQRKIRHTDKQGWEISDAGVFEAITVAKSTVVTSFFIFLHMQDKPALLIACDALSEDDYRQLIVKLKMTIH